MEKLTVYLAGACRGMHDGGKEWRLKAENIFLLSFISFPAFSAQFPYMAEYFQKYFRN